MNKTHENKHLNLEERKIIALGLEKMTSKKNISIILGKDQSTIGKEIKLHKELIKKFKYKLPCINYKHCPNNHNCSNTCMHYVQFKCKMRDKMPGVCNGCANRKNCPFDQYIYNPEKAQKNYKESLKNSHKGIKKDLNEINKIGNIISPLIKHGLSPYQIICAHPEINISKQTLYNYIDKNVFKEFGICNIDLRRKVKWKVKKRTKAYNTIKNYIIGHKYSDYKKFISENPNKSIVEMDTVSNTINGPCIQTFLFKKMHFIFAIYHEKKNSKNMLDGIKILTDILGINLFKKYVEVIITDRGTEFSEPSKIELYDNIERTKIFYCDPMKPGQKGEIEKKHTLIRYIIPKGNDFKYYGLYNQDSLNQILSNINSLPLSTLNGKSALQFINFLYPEIYEKFIAYGIKEIPFDEININNNLLK